MPTKKRTKLVRVPATTNNITKGIINYLISRGHFAFRVNSGGVYDPKKKVFRIGITAGVADIICVRNTDRSCFTMGGNFLAIEVKNKSTKDRMRPAQKKFRGEIESRNADYCVAIGYEEFVKWFETYFG